MAQQQLIEALIASRRALGDAAAIPRRRAEAEGGCGVIGMASSVPVAGRHLLQALHQMRNRGNAKGGGIAAVGLDPAFFGVQPEVLAGDYLLTIAYLDGTARPEVESACIEPTFMVDVTFQIPTLPDFRAIPGLEIQPPDVWCYFVRVRPNVRDQFQREHGIAEEHAPRARVEDEIVYQHTYRLNRAFYASAGDKRAFVVSHGKNLLVLKMVGYGDDVIRYYRLEDLSAHVWIGHHRYPTKGKVWHPGGAHPFIGLHEALVHNGDFANYASICSYLAQRNIYPLFLTDTEVAALAFDLLHRLYGYPLEYLIEAMAPTTERDFTLLPPEKQRLYNALQAVHMHGSPDGPWFFLVAQSDVRNGDYRLIGITDTSMLRPQVFALQAGAASIGFAASEKQAIDAALESLTREDARFWSRADRYWNARGGSHTDGGAFIFTLRGNGANGAGMRTMLCTDKFGHAITADSTKRPPDDHAGDKHVAAASVTDAQALIRRDLAPSGLLERACEQLPAWDYADLRALLEGLERTAVSDDDRDRAIALLTLLLDRRYPTGEMKRSGLLALCDQSLARLVESVRASPSRRYVWVGSGSPLPEPRAADAVLVLDARGYPAEGSASLARAIVAAYRRGFHRMLVANTRGQRFIGCGLGPDSDGVRIDVYGSSGDYLASGLDGAEVVVHGSAQDQLAQILKRGRLIVHGDVGQTFMYAAKGGDVFVLGDAAGRPLINGVGRPNVVINGTCLDYLAESFMAGDPLNGGGFVILNGVRFDEDGHLEDLAIPYPGGNLFSLASGGAIYLRDPHGRVTKDQLNGGEFTELKAQDWDRIRPALHANETIFGIPVSRLLAVEGDRYAPEQIYRKIRPTGHKALMPEEAWVKREA